MHGKDLEFMSNLADLGICIEELQEAYPTAPLYIRGDVNVKNANREMCKLDHPTILSHHDVILSDFSLQSKPEDTNDDIHCEAPKVEIKREKIIWSDEGIKEFKNIVTPQL